MVIRYEDEADQEDTGTDPEDDFRARGPAVDCTAEVERHGEADCAGEKDGDAKPVHGTELLEARCAVSEVDAW